MEKVTKVQPKKDIRITYKGNEYVLEFTRRTVEQMERNGFKIEMVSEQAVIGIPTLFRGAFLANHRFVKQELMDEIYNSISNKVNLISKLAEMYNEPLIALLDGEEKPEGEQGWTANF